MTPADRRVLLYYTKMALKGIWYMCLIPVAIIGMFVVIPFLTLRMIFYGMGVATTATSQSGRVALANIIADNSTTQEGDYATLENGFNVDLERDFVGASQVRK